jgi:hypothetical protein
MVPPEQPSDDGAQELAGSASIAERVGTEPTVTHTT